MESKANTTQANIPQANIPLGEIRNRFWKEFQNYFKKNYKNIIEKNNINIGEFIFNVNDSGPHVMQVYSYNQAGLNIHLSTNSKRRYMEVHLIYFHNGNHIGTYDTEHFVINKIYNNICENNINTLLNNENNIVNLEKRENPHSYDTLYYKYNEYSIRNENKWSEYFPVLSETIVNFVNDPTKILNGI
jgi:hypothetical protein